MNERIGTIRKYKIHMYCKRKKNGTLCNRKPKEYLSSTLAVWAVTCQNCRKGIAVNNQMRCNN